MAPIGLYARLCHAFSSCSSLGLRCRCVPAAACDAAITGIQKRSKEVRRFIHGAPN